MRASSKGLSVALTRTAVLRFAVDIVFLLVARKTANTWWCCIALQAE